MGIRDKHDPREAGFRHFAKLDANGNVVAIVEVIDQPDPATQQPTIPTDSDDALHVDVTDLHPYDFTDVKSTKTNVSRKDKAAIHEHLRVRNKVVKGG